MLLFGETKIWNKNYVTVLLPKILLLLTVTPNPCFLTPGMCIKSENGHIS